MSRGNRRSDSDSQSHPLSSWASLSSSVMDPVDNDFDSSVLSPLVSESNDSDYGDSKADDYEPPPFKMRKEKPKNERPSYENSEKLEDRLGGILCCVVCLDLPRTAIYQCANGHLMCAGCFTHLLADARLRDETPLCPNCRTLISKDICSRNLAAEKAVSELPAACRYCTKELPRSQLDYHEMSVCEDRLIECRYSRIGCPWRGRFHEQRSHEVSCGHPLRSGADVMESLEVIDKKRREELLVSARIYDLLSYESISFNDIQFKPYRTDEFIHKLRYETSRFVAFNNQWIVKASVNDNQRDPTQSCERSLSYQLVLKTKIGCPVMMHYIILKGPYGDMKVVPQIYHYEFSEGDTESFYQVLPLSDSAECNKLLSAKIFNCRLIMFQKKLSA